MNKMQANKLGILLLTVVIFALSTFAVLAEENIVITGFSTGDLQFSVADVKQLPSITMDVVSVNSSGHEKKFTITGSTLADLLKTFGKSQASLDAIRLIAGDGYSIEVPGEVLKNRQIILAYLVDGNSLDEKTRPIRVIIPEERAMYWLRNLTTIEVLGVSEEIAIEKVHFLETAVAQLETVPYTYYENVDKAVQVAKLLEVLKIAESKSIALEAVDGLKKNESLEIFTSGYIKVTGTDAPLFLSPDLPKGMHVKQILDFTGGESAVFSLTKGLESFQEITLDGTKGISLEAVANQLGLRQAEQYRLIANDGYAVEVTRADLAKGIVFIDEKGRVKSYFSGLPKNTSVKGLQTIEAVNE